MTRLARLFARNSDRLFSFIDQGMQGLANVVITLLLARAMSVDAFASVGLMLGIYYFVFSFHRSCVVLPFILDEAGAPAAGATETEWWSASLAFTVLAETVLAAAAVVLELVAVERPHLGWIADALVYVVVVTVPLLAAEFGRRAFYQSGGSRRAAAASTVYLVAGVGVAALAIRLQSPLVGVLAFAAAGTASTVLYLALRRPALVTVGTAYRRWRPHAAFAIWQSLTSIAFLLYTTSAVVLVAAFAGPVAAAVYTAARTLVNPAISIVSAVDSLDKPRAARSLAQGGMAALRASIARTRHLLLVLTGGYLAVVFAFAPSLLEHAFGAAYASNATAVRILAVGFLLMCINQPSETMLVVLRRARVLFLIRAGAALSAVALVWWGASYGVTGVAAAIAAVQLGALIALQIAERMVRPVLQAPGGAVATADVADRPGASERPD